MENILQQYGQLLASVDAWFNRSVFLATAEIACKEGCSGCCRGLFDITLLDACYLKQGFDRLDKVVQGRVLETRPAPKGISALTSSTVIWWMSSRRWPRRAG